MPKKQSSFVSTRAVSAAQFTWQEHVYHNDIKIKMTWVLMKNAPPHVSANPIARMHLSPDNINCCDLGLEYVERQAALKKTPWNLMVAP